MTGLSNQEIMVIINNYIGVSRDGYLGDFSYQSHKNFYPEFCGLNIDPEKYEGTTRKRFFEVISNSTTDVQSKIVLGVLERFPISAENKPATRTKDLYDNLVGLAKRLEGASPISSPTPKTTSSIVNRAISDIDTLINSSSGPVSGVDRIHTALHGYLQTVCDKEKITYAKEDSMAKLFKLLRQHHPALQNLGPHSQEIERVLHSFATVLDALNPIRNNASVAHPTNNLLERDEAMLVINSARTIIHYLDSKFG